MGQDKTIYTYHLNKCTMLLLSKVHNNIHTMRVSLVTALEKTSQYTKVMWVIPPQVCCIILMSLTVSVSTHCSHFSNNLFKEKNEELCLLAVSKNHYQSIIYSSLCF